MTIKDYPKAIATTVICALGAYLAKVGYFTGALFCILVAGCMWS